MSAATVTPQDVLTLKLSAAQSAKTIVSNAASPQNG